MRSVLVRALLAGVALAHGACGVGAPQRRTDVLEAQLVAHRASYRLPADPAYAERVRSAAQMRDLPPPPEVDLVLVLRNVSASPVFFAPGGDLYQLRLRLDGPGVVNDGAPNSIHLTPPRRGSRVELAPGARYEIPIQALSVDGRDWSWRGFWTEPGEVRLRAVYESTAALSRGSGLTALRTESPPLVLEILAP